MEDLVRIEINGQVYEMNREDALMFLGGQRKQSTARKLAGATMNVVKKGVGYLAESTKNTYNVKHSHPDHRAPHYEDPFERSANHQSRKEDGYENKFEKGIDEMFNRMSKKMEHHDSFSNYFDRHQKKMHKKNSWR